MAYSEEHIVNASPSEHLRAVGPGNNDSGAT